MHKEYDEIASASLDDTFSNSITLPDERIGALIVDYLSKYIGYENNRTAIQYRRNDVATEDRTGNPLVKNG